MFHASLFYNRIKRFRLLAMHNSHNRTLLKMKRNNKSIRQLLRPFAPPLSKRWFRSKRKRIARGPLTTPASTAIARSSCSSTCKQRSMNEGGKNRLTNDDRGAVILVVKLKRTDTTLDLSLYKQYQYLICKQR